MRVRVTFVALIVVLLAAGCLQEPPPPSDVAKIVAVQAPTTITQNNPFAIDVYAEDLGSTEYMVTLLSDRAPADAHLQSMTCNGTEADNPSADTPACEYDPQTTTIRTITKTRFQFLWSGSKGVRFSLQFCAASFTNEPNPFPTGGSCVTKELAVAS